LNRRLLDRLNGSGALYLTHTALHGRHTLRLCVGQTWTETRHLEAAWQRIQQTARELMDDAPHHAQADAD